MVSRDFVIWLRGFSAITLRAPDDAEWSTICEALDAVVVDKEVAFPQYIPPPLGNPLAPNVRLYSNPNIYACETGVVNGH